MKKSWKPILFAILSAAVLSVSGVLYRASGFSPIFALSVLFAAVIVGPATAAFSRLTNPVAALILISALSGSLVFTAGDLAAVALIATYVFSAPAVVVIEWMFSHKLRDLAFFGLPMQGLIAFGGLMGYCRLHFGDWNPVLLTERVELRLTEALEQFKPLYEKIYGGTMPSALEKQLQLSIESADETAYMLVMTAAYLLMGAFFLSAWFGDRCGRAAGQESLLGSWQVLIPMPVPSYLYMGAYLLVLLIADQNYLAWYAAFTLFGFFFVFTAVYRIRGFLRRKNLPEPVRILICGLLLGIAWASSSSAGLSAYTILLFFGWWSATSRIMIRFRREK